MVELSKRSREGYLFIDHRASPGLPEDFYRKVGIDAPAVGEGQVWEGSVLVCMHCNGPQIKNPMRTRERGYCRKCDGYVCDICSLNMRAADYVHKPFRERVDTTMEAMLRLGSGLFSPLPCGNDKLPLMAKDE